MKLLIPLDGNRWSEEILGWLAPFFALKETTAHVLHVAPLADPDADVTHAGPEGAPADAKAYVERIVNRLKGAATVQGHAWQGEPVVSIRRLAREVKADLIAMRTHARGTVGRLIFGSVMTEVLASSDVPVYVIGPASKPATGQLRKILVPLDGSALSLEILDDVVPIARSFASEVALFHAGTEASVMQPGLDRLVREKIPASASAGGGKKIAEAILGQASASGADLIAMTTHGRGAVMSLVMGSVAEALVRTAPIPLLARRPRTR